MVRVVQLRRAAAQMGLQEERKLRSRNVRNVIAARCCYTLLQTKTPTWFALLQPFVKLTTAVCIVKPIA
jgi:hypothetical protein